LVAKDRDPIRFKRDLPMNKITIFNTFKMPKLALLLLTITLMSTSAHSNQKPLTSVQIKSLMDETFNVMQRNYIQPEIVPDLVKLFTSKLKLGQYSYLQSVDEFAEVVGRDLRIVTGDSHLSLFTVKPDEEITHILSHQNGKLTYNFAFEEIKYLYGNIGYLKFNKFHSDERATDVVDAAFNFLKQSDGIILDLRDTIGGSPWLVQYMLGYFFSKETPLWDVLGINDKLVESISVTEEVQHHDFENEFPVWILTSHNSASATELFAGVMQASSKAVIVGDVTAGAGFYVGVRQITDELVFRISLSKPVITANQKNWEKTGIIPDLKVPSLDALSYAHALSLKINLTK
jgi:hypothetical protein